MSFDIDFPESKILLALVAVEEAQTLINEAAQLISPVDGLAPEWDELCALHARIKAAWHQLHNARHRPEVMPDDKHKL